MEATITSKGQVTLPKPIRDRLDLKAGDRIAFSMEDDGRLLVTPVTGSVMDLAGMLPRPPVPLSQEEMDEVVAQEAVRRALRD
ncbi:MAG: AbrB/MazE/SpoVT family DNA-binding domain-containing protein [Gemmatimonadota bacterium]|uniref:AbrB/MazE/SpoVT family DNA-binding domain-containing protein n=1 Tax=Candidatus Palauibacter scopulicola TaxID=3056741 RepID=UPI00238C5582|nr:AbrB/MazE/SpoVT family DNA-binding domain-containing protein [Candidatus Palauibacter scopulicola]MDE2661870.1 AbrB/MazE/SpoVT family DNA-binding domain-containing protein [Candidatus Palauibacter scopulicola]